MFNDKALSKSHHHSTAVECHFRKQVHQHAAFEKLADVDSFHEPYDTPHDAMSLINRCAGIIFHVLGEIKLISLNIIHFDPAK